MATPATNSRQGATASFSAVDLQQALQPVEVVGTLPDEAFAISTDTRSLRPGDAYLALSGETFDGHQFVANAIKGGASLCIVSKSAGQMKLTEGELNATALVRVENTLDAFHALAKFWKDKVGPIVIAVTGSSGKTTTKEMCASVVGSSRRIHKSFANENNEIGVPKSMLSMDNQCQILVLEMAMRGAGQIAQLAATASPDLGIITNCGTAHMELLGSEENIIKAKCELFEHMDAGKAVAVIGAPTPGLRARAAEVFKGTTLYFDSAKVKAVEVKEDCTRFSIDGFKRDFVVYAHGLAHIQDAWCAVMAGKHAGLSEDEIAAGLLSYRSPEGRGQRKKGLSGAVIVDESYNANPDSVRCAVEAVLDSRAFPQEKKFVVLGEMAELGSNELDLHFQLGQWLKDKPITSLLTVGEKAGHIANGAQGGSFRIERCSTQADAQQILEREAQADSCVMIKGSHCAGLDALVMKLTSN